MRRLLCWLGIHSRVRIWRVVPEGFTQHCAACRREIIWAKVWR